MAIAARPDSPRWAAAYPRGAAYSTLLVMGVGVTAASALAATRGLGAALQAAGWAMLFAWSSAWLWRSAVKRVPGTRDFADHRDRSAAQFACRSLLSAGLEFMLAETWDNLSRASLADHRSEFDEILRAVGGLAAGAKLRDPAKRDAREFAAHVRALDSKLREDPKQLG